MPWIYFCLSIQNRFLAYHVKILLICDSWPIVMQQEYLERYTWHTYSVDNLGAELHAPELKSKLLASAFYNE